MRVLERLRVDYVSRDQSTNRHAAELMLSGYSKEEGKMSGDIDIIQFVYNNWKKRITSERLEAIVETKPETIRVNGDGTVNEQDLQNWLKRAKKYLADYF